MYRISGTDLAQIEGISAVTAHVFFSEVGCEVSKFPKAGNLVSWLNLYPNNKITGGKVLSSRTYLAKTGLQKPYKCQRCHYAEASHTSIIIIGENEQ